MVLVDTSSWVETLRERGDATVRQRVSALVLAGEAAWCNIVRLELWHGVRGGRETRDLAQLESLVVLLPIDDMIWDRAIQLARAARMSGLTVPVPDLVIVATAHHHQIEVDSIDAHVEQLMSLR